MASATTHNEHALRHEYESLSRQAAHLTISLARRRADIALMRAEAATVAVSLEAAKDHLDDLLRKEALIRTRAPPPPLSSSNSKKPRPDFAPDKGLVRSLAGQLDVTRKSVQAALAKKLSMQNEIYQLEKLIQAQQQPHQNEPDSLAANFAVPVMRLSSFTLSSPRSSLDYRTDKLTSAHLSGASAAAAVGSKQQPKGCVAQHVLDALRQGALSASSFRVDHARIWRDATMPNLALARADLDKVAPDDISFGVVIERIFEGVTCFSPTEQAERRRRSADMRIESTAAVQKAAQDLATAVVHHFASLSVSLRDDPEKVHLFAPKIALARVMELISDNGKDRVKRPQPKLRTDDEQQPTGIEHNASADSVLSSGSSRSPRRSRSDSMDFTVRLLAASHVLHAEHFRQVIAQGVPIRFRGSAMRLVYSTNVHGISLHTLFHRVKTTFPTLIAIRDTEDRAFGCYAAAPWKSSATRYYGSGESFVFGTDGPEVAKVYKWSRENSFFQFTSSNFLAIGGGAGSHFALWVDEDLLMGTTSACSTFASPPLTNVGDEDAPACVEFKIVAMEVWGFNAHLTSLEGDRGGKEG